MRHSLDRISSPLTSFVIALVMVSIGGCGGGGGSASGNSGGNPPAAVQPTFTVQPTDQTAAAGSMATFTTTAVGTPTPTYQWERSADGITWAPIAGASNASYRISTQITDHGAKFRAKASNSAGVATSGSATLAVNTLPMSLSNGQVVPGEVVAANGWRLYTIQVPSGAAYLDVRLDNPTNDPDLYVRLGSAPTLSQSDANSVGITAESVRINLPGAGTWYIGAYGYDPISASTYTITASYGGGAGSTVPVFTTHPSSLTLAPGGTATFTAVATGTPAPTYQWERSPNGATWTAVSGATSSVLTMTAQSTDNGAQFRAKASNSMGTAISNSALLTVNSAVSIDPKRRISAGESHSLWLTPDGTVWTWGSTNNRTAPTQVAGLSGQFMAVSAGGSHSLVLKSDGTVWAWGTNSYGQLGDGTTVDRTAPVAVVGLPPNVIAIAAGTDHSLALTASGNVWGWGYNGMGQIGDGTTVVRYTPVSVQGLSGIQDLAASRDTSLALKSDGTVWEWGIGSILTNRPSQRTSLSGIVALAAGTYHAMALQADGALLAWGSNTWGQLGDDTGRPSDTPVSVKGASNVRAMSAGGTFSVGLRTDGSLWAWGDNGTGQLGEGTSQTRYAPWPVTGMGSDVVAVAAGGYHCLALKADGTVWAWGDNSWSQLGDGTYLGSQHSPVRVAGMEGPAARMAGGNSHGLAMGADGRVWAWGANASGQLGDTTIVNRMAPVPVDGIREASSVAGGGDHCLALKSDGSLIWAWGLNTSGQLGDGTTTDRLAPIQVTVSAGRVTAIAAGASHSLALKEDGTVWAWGSNAKGQLGNGTNTDALSPVQVIGLTGKITAVAAGVAHSLALRDDGTVWAWGLNFEGELGNGTTTNSSRPVQVLGLVNVIKVVSGHFHNLALKSDGTAFGWGDNLYGQIGDGSNRNDRLTPVQLSSLSDLQDIAAGELHSLALKRDGTVWGSGANQYSQLGSAPLETAVPVQLTDQIQSLAAGQYFSLGMKSDGTMWAWGYGLYGQLGDGSRLPVRSSSPVRVCSRVVGVGP